ncbi:MAG: hypothetical protein OEV06_04490 [Anaerolineae bacterium]|nr:hypothetical protein [Anaerolineae bacterium]
MVTSVRSASSQRYLRSGAVAGGVSTLAFTIIHDIFISDIWMMFPIMLVAGAVCGLCVAWSYRLLVTTPSTGSWLRYNLMYVGLFGLLAAASELAFEPVTTVAALSAANEPAGELIAQALPMTVIFTLAAAVLITFLYGIRWRLFGPVLLTCAVLVLFLGLNVSIIGLVAFPSSAYYLVAEMFGLILSIDLVYVLVFIGLERRCFLNRA